MKANGKIGSNGVYVSDNVEKRFEIDIYIYIYIYMNDHIHNSMARNTSCGVRSYSDH